MLSNEVAIILPDTGAVWRPDILAFGENRLDNVRILVILPGFLWCSAHSERYWAVCQAAKSRSECAVNYKKTTKSQVFSFARTYARILPGFFVKIRLDFARIFTKNEPDWRISHTVLLVPITNWCFFSEKIAAMSMWSNCYSLCALLLLLAM